MFAFVKTPYWERADEDTKEGLAELIEQLGEQVEEIELLPSAIDAWELHRTIMEAEMAVNLEREWNKGRDRLSEQLQAQPSAGATCARLIISALALGSRRSMKASSSFSSSATTQS